MAKMHSRKRGKSGSKKPIKKVVPDWVKITKKEVVELVIKLAKEGKPLSAIGMTLRDQYGVPSVKIIVGKSIKQILEEEKIAPKYPEDLLNLLKKSVKLCKHLETNKKDHHNKRALQLAESKIRRLVKYYKSKKVLPESWYYDPKQAALIIREG